MYSDIANFSKQKMVFVTFTLRCYNYEFMFACCVLREQYDKANEELGRLGVLVVRERYVLNALQERRREEFHQQDNQTQTEPPEERLVCLLLTTCFLVICVMAWWYTCTYHV